MLDDLKNIFKGDKFYTKIILINVIVFVVYNLIGQFIPAFAAFVSNWFSIPAELLYFITRPWTIVSYMFLHSGLGHIFYNMLILYWFSRIFGDFMGQQRLAGVYFLGGIAGAGLYLLVYNILFLAGEFSESMIQSTSMVGASAGVMAVVAATGLRFKDYEMSLILIGPVKLKYLALAIFVLSTLFDFMSNLGGNVAHIGGAALGYFYIKGLDKGQDWAFSFYEKSMSILKLFERKPKLKVVPNQKAASSKKKGTSTSFKSPPKSVNSEVQAKTDAILDKISKSGYENLTKEEKEFLFKLSNKD